MHILFFILIRTAGREFEPVTAEAMVVPQRDQVVRIQHSYDPLDSVFFGAFYFLKTTNVK